MLEKDLKIQENQNSENESRSETQVPCPVVVESIQLTEGLRSVIRPNPVG